RLDELYNVMESQQFRIYSSSVLLLYEGDPKVWKNWESQQSPQNKVQNLNNNTPTSASSRTLANEGKSTSLNGYIDDTDLYDLRLVDFAHTRWTPGQGPHQNFLKSLLFLRGQLVDSKNRITNQEKKLAVSH
ncbi:hypothetical protein IWQ61_001928, partial [Dispira simplex]